MLSTILRFFFGKRGQGLSKSERELSDTIKKLQTLKVTNGGVSISPSEVTRQTGYLEERKQAAKLVNAGGRPIISWGLVDSLGADELGRIFAASLKISRMRGDSFEQAIEQLKLIARKQKKGY